MAKKKTRQNNQNNQNNQKSNLSLFSVIFVILMVVILLGIGVRVFHIGTQLFFSEQKPAAVIKSFSGNFLTDETVGYFLNKKVAVPESSLPQNKPDTVLGTSDGAERWVEVDLSEQKLKAWDGDSLFLETLVSTGKWGRTPTGEFTVWSKFRYTTMSGGDRSINTYYYLPNVPYTMFFGGPSAAPSMGFALHGTYWHNNFGSTMSHGCVNLPTAIAEKIFNWSGPTVAEGKNVASPTTDNPGLRIVIHE